MPDELVIELLSPPWVIDFREHDHLDERIVIGGVGSGKSFACADLLIERGIEAPFARHYIVGDSYPTLKEGTIPTFESRLDAYGFDFVRNGSDLSVTVTSGPAKGCRFIAWTANKYRKLKGQMIDTVWCDEAQVWFEGGEHGADAYDFIVNRMRPSEQAQKYYPNLSPRLVLSANPPHTTSHWLYRYFVEEKKAKLWQVTLYDNPLLPRPEEYVARLRRAYSPALFKIEVLGEFGDIGVGLVYDSFRRKDNVSEFIGRIKIGDDPERPGYSRKRPIEWYHDFGVNPRVSVLGQTYKVAINGFQHEVLFLFDEITNTEGGSVVQIREFTRRYPPEVVCGLTAYGDPAGIARNSTTGKSDWSMLATSDALRPYKMQINKRSKAPPIVDRTAAVNCKLRNAADEIGIVFHPLVRATIADVQRTRWKDGTRILDHGSPAKGIFRTHWSDAIGYGVERKWPATKSQLILLAASSGNVRAVAVEPPRQPMPRDFPAAD